MRVEPKRLQLQNKKEKLQDLLLAENERAEADKGRLLDHLQKEQQRAEKEQQRAEAAILAMQRHTEAGIAAVRAQFGHPKEL